MELGLKLKEVVCPTGEGMNRNLRPQSAGRERMPHRRGDEPNEDEAYDLIDAYAPQAWG